MHPDVSTTALRLLPIDRPRSLLVRLFNWLLRRKLGKVMMPSRVIYARFPGLLWRTLPMYHLLERGLNLERELRLLVELRVSAQNGCSFCTDLHRAEATRGEASQAKLEAAVRGSALAEFSARERAALQFVTECTRGVVSDDTFEALRAAFSEREVVELTWLQAFTTYLNRLASPLGIGSDGFCSLSARKQRH
jgi:AhpD family alkylhydroperoxidase